MYADSLDGPWTEYAANPVIANVWSPHFSVNHVSSPDAIWNTAEDSLFLYFHGGNDATRFATSADGVTFTYGGVAVNNAMGGSTTTETSYARVFPHPIRRRPSSTACSTWRTPRPTRDDPSRRVGRRSHLDRATHPRRDPGVP